MNLNSCIRAARDELLAAGAAVTVEEVMERALALNGAQCEFEEQALIRARRELKREVKRALQESTEEPVADQGQLSLFALLPGAPAPRAITLPGGDGEYAYKSFAATTDADLEAHDSILEENIKRALLKRRDHNDKRTFLAPYRLSDATTTLEALSACATSQERAA